MATAQAGPCWRLFTLDLSLKRHAGEKSFQKGVDFPSFYNLL
jgi:hypothetical protein